MWKSTSLDSTNFADRNNFDLKQIYWHIREIYWRELENLLGNRSVALEMCFHVKIEKKYIFKKKRVNFLFQ